MPKDQFKTRLEIAKSKFLRKNLAQKNENPSSIGTAFKMSTELVSAVAVGTIIGFILDKTFGTKPWLILIFFFIGVVAGIMNVIKSAKKMQSK
jgi:ATP synthase protein I